MTDKIYTQAENIERLNLFWTYCCIYFAIACSVQVANHFTDSWGPVTFVLNLIVSLVFLFGLIWLAKNFGRVEIRTSLASFFLMTDEDGFINKVATRAALVSWWVTFFLLQFPYFFVNLPINVYTNIIIGALTGSYGIAYLVMYSIDTSDETPEVM